MSSAENLERVLFDIAGRAKRLQRGTVPQRPTAIVGLVPSCAIAALSSIPRRSAVSCVSTTCSLSAVSGSWPRPTATTTVPSSRTSPATGWSTAEPALGGGHHVYRDRHRLRLYGRRHGNPYDNAKAESFMKTLKVRGRLSDGLRNARLPEPGAVRGSPRPADGQNRRVILSTVRGALQ